MQLKSHVTRIPAAPSPQALVHFEAALAFETDCWDVHASLQVDEPGFVLLDVRARELFEKGHVAGAIHHPHAQLTAQRLEDYPVDTLFVVYCSGPHCNGADKAAVRLARLGRPVKKMIGGVTGWLDEGFTLTAG